MRYKNVNDLAILAKEDSTKIPELLTAINPFLNTIAGTVIGKRVSICYKDDLLQELRIKVIKYLKNYDCKTAKFTTFIYINLLKTCKDFIGAQVSSLRYTNFGDPKYQHLKLAALNNVDRTEVDYEIDPIRNITIPFQTSREVAEQYIEEIRPLINKLSKTQKGAIEYFLEHGNCVPKDGNSRQKIHFNFQRAVKNLRSLTVSYK